jgi:hypothetical protein
MGKEKNRINPYVLGVAGAALLTGAWLMRSLPLFIFVGIAPLFALTDRAQKDNRWNKLELVGVALAISLWAGWIFATEFLVNALLEAIAITVVFVGFTFVRQSLGARVGKIPLILFWLALEYLFLKLHFTNQVLFLADTLQLKKEWYAWTDQTGYLGLSLWILMVNFVLYLGSFQQGIRVPYLVLFIVLLIAPIIYSYTLTNESVLSRPAMEALYYTNQSEMPVYQDRGEWISRTAAWISVLIVLFAIVKHNTSKNERTKKN